MRFHPLRHVVTAQTYEERYNLLNPKLGLLSYFLPSSLDMLKYFNGDDSDSKESDNYGNSDDGTESEEDEGESKSHLLEDCDPNGSSTCLLVPLVDDPNTGPAEAWRWAHLKFEFPFIFYNIEMRELRRWGYVMWDHERLIEGGLFDSPWQEPDDIDYEEIRRREDVMNKSIEKRYLLYAKGAMGWWEEGDESKLVWKGWKLSDDTVEMWYLSRRRT
ncbi:hypothetical protein AWENTII_000158 [Aspergillus wentii]